MAQEYYEKHVFIAKNTSSSMRGKAWDSHVNCPVAVVYYVVNYL